MNRTLLIARREFAAYAMTVGFWLSLLAFPLFGLLGGGFAYLVKNSEPEREVVLIEEGAEATGLAAIVRDALAEDAERQAAEAREVVQAAEKATGAPVQPAVAEAATRRSPIRFVEAPADLAASTPGEAQDELLRQYLGKDIPKSERLDAVVFLTRVDGKPTARVWSANATDGAVRRFVGDALKSANRREVFAAAGINPAVVIETETYDPQVRSYSPRSVSGGAVTDRDRIPLLIGLASSFLLWSLVITGASILLNSVMEEKSNKILEVLLSSASATEILAGKVLGVALLTLTVLLAWGGLGAIGLITAAPSWAADVGTALLDGGLIFYFLAYTVGGYLMYAVLFAAIGAFCETPRDAQTLMGPIMMVLVVPLLVVQLTLNTPDSPIVRFLSWVPFFTPFLMPARAPLDPPVYEIVGTMAGMFAFALLMVWIAGRAFRAGALSDVKLSWKSFAGAIMGGGR
ncbi:MAG: ABC transporter permease [Brevundimonas sp.]|uniref:ABC transporter permease n=1 Tax=Brevundimonas sp. TaxID=1871086 RepID=UPI002732F7DF|nr:ABC transporter permease [Brevundimonas sp.]MDP3377259.1 ABC transporter permease [Brevundimonas sp.]